MLPKKNKYFQVGGLVVDYVHVTLLECQPLFGTSRVLIDVQR